MNLLTTTVHQKSVVISEEQALTILKAFIPVQPIAMLKRINDMTSSAIHYEEKKQRMGSKYLNQPELEVDYVINQIKTEMDLAQLAFHLRDTLNAPEECKQALAEVQEGGRE
jgi:hypothetical protein